MAWTETARWQYKRENARYLSDLRDGGMSADRANVSGSAESRPTAHGLPAPGDGCNFIYFVERLRLADAAQMLRAGFDGARLFLGVQFHGMSSSIRLAGLLSTMRVRTSHSEA